MRKTNKKMKNILNSGGEFHLKAKKEMKGDETEVGHSREGVSD